jgi:AraC-like DNA-binding protein
MPYTIGIVISFFLCLLLLGKKNKNAADYLLSFWMFWIGLHLLSYYLFFAGEVFEHPNLLGFNIPMPLLHPPLLFLYTATLCRGGLPRKWWVHLLLPLAFYIYLIPFMLLPAERKVWVFQHAGQGYEGFILAVNIAINLSGVVYSALAFRLLRRHRKLIGDLYSNQEKINLQWLQWLIVGIALIWVLVLASTDEFVFTGAVLFVLFIGYFGIRQVGIFTNPAAIALAQPGYFEREDDELTSTSNPDSTTADTPETPVSTQAIDKKKYEKSGLTPAAAGDLRQRLRYLMQDQQLFKEADLSLTDLAERLNVHPNYLSQLINETEGKNFYDYVNSMRVEAFLKMASLPENQRFTLLALAFDCGFNSKSAFNRYFKKTTGMSPSQYLNRGEE